MAQKAAQSRPQQKAPRQQQRPYPGDIPRGGDIDLGCCQQNPAASNDPALAINIGPQNTSLRGETLLVIFVTSHPCGIKSYEVAVTVENYDMAPFLVVPLTRRRLRFSLSCERSSPEFTTKLQRIWYWAPARDPGLRDAIYMGPLPDDPRRPGTPLNLIGNTVFVKGIVFSCCDKIAVMTPSMLF